jgi:YidC/Oxa1 family membrane protein insertase
MDLILNPFITLLTLLYSIFGNNMVIAIAVFTVLVRLATYPLTAQQLRSSFEMQKLQPKMKELQEKYKNDREKLAQEQMKLYRDHNINPVGGCLPLLIQFPILIALYQAVIHALAGVPTHLIDVSGRLLIPDLGRLLPLNNMFLGMNLSQPPNMSNVIAIAIIGLTVVTTWLQMKLSMPKPQASASADGKPDQMAGVNQSMTTIMPIMYGFFALSFSIGLSIYFIISNLIGIVQAWVMKRQREQLEAAAGATGGGTITLPPKVTPTTNGKKPAATVKDKPKSKTKAK